MLEYFIENKEPSWCAQFKIACMLSPQIDADNMIVDEVTGKEALMHLLTIPWKLLFAVIPPRRYAGGWAAFVIGLAVIGVITAVVAELAGLVGCAINLKVSVTAITLVAMGTSLPDTFASMTAAKQS